MMRRRFLVYFLIVSAITIGATIGLESWSFRRAIDHSLHQNLLFARSVARVISGVFAQEEGRLLLLLTDLSAMDDPKAMQDRLQTMRGQPLDFDGSAVFDQDRQLVVSDAQPAGLPPSEVLLPALRKAEASGKLVLTDMWLGADKKPRAALVLGRKVPAVAKDKQVAVDPAEAGTPTTARPRTWLAAVVYARLDGAGFQRTFNHFLVNEQSRLQLLDSAGVAMFSTQPAERFRSAVHGTYFSDKVRLGQTAQMPCHSCHEGGGEPVREDEVTTVAPLAGLDWTVTVREGTRDLYAPMQETVFTSTALVCLIFGCFVGYYVLLSRRVLRPMRQLAETAANLAEEQAGHELSLHGRDEFDVLTQSLQAMRNKLPSEVGARSLQPPTTGTALGVIYTDLRIPLAGLLDDIAASKAVQAVMLHLQGSALREPFLSTRAIDVRSEQNPAEILTKMAVGRTRVPRAELEQAGLVLENDADIKLFYVQPIRVGQALVGALWIGVSDSSESKATYLEPTLALLASQAQSLLERTLLYDQLRAEQVHKNRMLRHLFEAESEERKRIAREIHDQTAQELTALLLMLETVPGDEQGSLGKAKKLVGQILDGLNRLVRRLRPAVLDDMGLGEAIRNTAQALLEQAGVNFHLELQGSDVGLSKEIENTVYRVFQEAATNIVRHAGAKKVTMSVAINSDQLHGRIEDDGKGMDLSWLEDLGARPRWGLLGMRERIIQLGGSIDFSTPSHGGLRIDFRVPLPEETPRNAEKPQ